MALQIEFDEIARRARKFNSLKLPDQGEVMVLSGGLNYNAVFQFYDRELCDKAILRFPKLQEERDVTRFALQEEYDAIGATDHDINFRFRSIKEQADFTRKCSTLGLHVRDYLDVQDDALLVKYVRGTPLSQYVASPRDVVDKEVIKEILTNLTKAHKQGVVFGDRWTSNTIVTPDGSFTELDFDLELQGAHSAISSFELAQTLYHLIHFSVYNRSLIKSIILDIYTGDPKLLSEYGSNTLRTFMLRQTEFFRGNNQDSGGSYCGLTPPYEEVYELTIGLAEIQKRFYRIRGVSLVA